MFSGFLASLFSIIAVLASVFGVPSAVEPVVAAAVDSTSEDLTGPEGRPTLQSTSVVAVNDDRVAQLWEDGRRECTAGYIGNDWWLTASHCMGRNLEVRQADGDKAAIVAATTIASRVDIALLKSEPIDATAFELPNRELKVDEKLWLVGFGAANDFASEAVVKIESTGLSDEFQGYEFDDLLVSRSVFASRSCNGDSGGPLYQDNTIFAVHTGGEDNETCTDGVGRYMWHTEIYPFADAIRALMKSYDEQVAVSDKKAALAKQAQTIEKHTVPKVEPTIQPDAKESKKDRSSSLSSFSSR